MPYLDPMFYLQQAGHSEAAIARSSLETGIPCCWIPAVVTVLILPLPDPSGLLKTGTVIGSCLPSLL